MDLEASGGRDQRHRLILRLYLLGGLGVERCRWRHLHLTNLVEIGLSEEGGMREHNLGLLRPLHQEKWNLHLRWHVRDSRSFLNG